jgi:hypothetical protein
MKTTAQLFTEMTALNAKLPVIVRKAMRSGKPQDFAALTAAKKPALAAHRAFFARPDAYNYARQMGV